MGPDLLLFFIKHEIYWKGGVKGTPPLLPDLFSMFTKELDVVRRRKVPLFWLQKTRSGLTGQTSYRAIFLDPGSKTLRKITVRLPYMVEYGIACVLFGPGETFGKIVDEVIPTGIVE